MVNFRFGRFVIEYRMSYISCDKTGHFDYFLKNYFSALMTFCEYGDAFMVPVKQRSWHLPGAPAV